MRVASRLRHFTLFALLVLAAAGPAQAQLIIAGNDDEKVRGDDNGNLTLMTTISGPPTNLAITPDERLALVANSVGRAR